MTRYLRDFPEELIIRTLRAYLIHGDSHRSIQKNILGIPAPARGGGFVAMEILHHYEIKPEHKSILTNSPGFESGSHMLSKAINKVKEFNSLETIANNAIENNNVLEFEKSVTTEMEILTKQRIGQSVLRKISLRNYSNKCAVCSIHQNDLLVCSHIIPWNIDVANRLNPSNAIIFCNLHDGLFDKGYFSLDDDYGIVLSNKSDSLIIKLLNSCSFIPPVRNPPNLDLLKFHRKEICKIDP